MGRSLVSIGCWSLLLCVAAVSAIGAVQGVDSSLHPGDGPAPLADAGQGNGSANVSGPPIEPDSVVLDVSVDANGSATWRIEFRTRLHDRADLAAFERYQADLRGGSATASQTFYDRIRASIAAAAKATGRPMHGSDFSTNVELRRIPERVGVVVYTFRWDGFATVSTDRITVRDALVGFFLNENEQLLVSWPAGYTLSESDPPPDARRERTVVWTGPTELGAGQPSLVVAETPGPLSRLLPVAAIVVSIVAASAFVWFRFGDDVTDTLAGGSSDAIDRDPELLSNEERVVTLLERNGGRIKQRTVAEELGWSETKTSYVVRDLRQDGRIHSFRLGRQNVLSLPDRQGSGGHS